MMRISSHQGAISCGGINRGKRMVSGVTQSPNPPAHGPPLPRIFCGELSGCLGAGWSLRVVSSGGHVRDPGYITLIGHISYGERAKQAGCEMRDACRTFKMVVRKPELVPGFYCACPQYCFLLYEVILGM